MKLYVIAGEASGDLHGANLIKELMGQRPGLEVRAWGGDRMAAEGAQVVKHIRDLAFMGFAEVVMNLRTIAKNFRECKADIVGYTPDAVILIDYPGFNLRMAEYIHGLGIPVLYYISPQIWAWKKGRVHKIKKYVKAMYVILPFEKDFYAQYDMEVEYVGHPLLDEIERYRSESVRPIESDKKILALLPGSRKQEIESKLPIMAAMHSHFPDHELIVAKAPSTDLDLYRRALGSQDLRIVEGRTYDLLEAADMAMVTSGTATLETALFAVPQVVCYKGNPLSYQIAKRVVDIKYISLVNLIMDSEVVTELIQGGLTAETLKAALADIAPDGRKRQETLTTYALLKERLGGVGASQKAAMSMLKTLDARL